MKTLRFIFPFTFAGLLLMVTVTVAHAQTSGESNPILPKMSCEELMAQDFSQLPDAATQILAAKVVTETGSTYCRVTGYSAPQIQFEVRLPTTSWTGRYVQVGCGGFCGYIEMSQKLQWEGLFGTCTPDNLGESVVAATNGGHVGGDSKWAQGAPQLVIDWAYRSEHTMLTFANALMSTFYGQAPTYRYFSGCSNGGRQGLMLAQRYPDDFDGILVGAPAIAIPAQIMEFAWSARVNSDEHGKLILTEETFPLLHEAVLAACDGKDGLVDGLLDDPRACDFDPGVLACAGESQQACLSPAQVEAARKLYGGPVDSSGRRLYPSGLPLGSELEWHFLFYGWNPPVSPGFSESFASDYLRTMASWDESLSLEKLRFDLATFNKLAEMSPLYDVTDPDLSAFRDRGGKLIIWHGWEDASAPPQNTINYYAAVQNKMGGLDKTEQFARLYMIPGFGHCSGGSALPQFEMFTSMINWVERDIAPEEIVIEHSDGEETIRTRPVYPYPTVARYDGSGNEDLASNFKPLTPTVVNDTVPWMGQYQSGYQQWCAVEGKELRCQETPLE